MRKHSLAAPLIASLAAQPRTEFADQAAWLAHLERLGFTELEVTPRSRARSPDPVKIATEGALRGSVQSHKFLCDGVVLSDDAGQFNVGHHALCWATLPKVPCAMRMEWQGRGTRSGWCTSWMRSPTGTVPLRRGCAA